MTTRPIGQKGTMMAQCDNLDAAFDALPTDMDRRRWATQKARGLECPDCGRKGQPMKVWRNGYVSCVDITTCAGLHSRAFVAARGAAQ